MYVPYNTQPNTVNHFFPDTKNVIMRNIRKCRKCLSLLRQKLQKLLVCIYSLKYRVNSKVPVHTIKAYKGNRGTAPSILNSAIDEVSGQLHVPAALYLPGFEPRTVQSVEKSSCINHPAFRRHSYSQHRNANTHILQK